jgi:RNA polymerase-binding transcription factor DksA
MLDKSYLNEIEKELYNQHLTVEKQLSSLKVQDPYSDPERLSDNAASDADASEESNHERVEALEKTLQAKLNDIKHALTRIKNGKYGKCENCGSVIEKERLSIKITANFCVKCEIKQEK